MIITFWRRWISDFDLNLVGIKLVRQEIRFVTGTFEIKWIDTDLLLMSVLINQLSDWNTSRQESIVSSCAHIVLIFIEFDIGHYDALAGDNLMKAKDIKEQHQ